MGRGGRRDPVDLKHGLHPVGGSCLAADDVLNTGARDAIAGGMVGQTPESALTDGGTTPAGDEARRPV